MNIFRTLKKRLVHLNEARNIKLTFRVSPTGMKMRSTNVPNPRTPL